MQLSLHLRARWQLPCWLALLLCLGLAGCSHLPAPQTRAPSYAVLAAQTPLGQWVQMQQQQSQTPYPNAFVLLESAHDAFISRLALIEAATASLDIQYYAIHDDPSTAGLIAATLRAAQRGVRVRILLDDFHSAGPHTQVMQLAYVPGVEMRLFNPLAAPRGSVLVRAVAALRGFARNQQRMHNKLFIADNSLGITGGRNLGDAYFDALASNNFIDLDLMAAGPVVAQMSSSFDRYWNDVLAYPVQELLTPQQLEQLRTAAQAHTLPAAADEHRSIAQLQPMDLERAPWVWAPAALLADAPHKIASPASTTATPPATPHAASAMPATETAQAASEPPPSEPAALEPLAAAPDSTATLTDNQAALLRSLPAIAVHEDVVSGLLALIDHAQSDLLIVTPYFVPGDDMKRAFARAHARGVRLRVLTNSLASNDAPIAHVGYARHRPALLGMGLDLYELRGWPVQQTSVTLTDTLRRSAQRLAGNSTRSKPPRAMLHSKLMVVDQVLTVVGSMNLDLRSQLHNTEIALLIASPELAARATAGVEHDLLTSAWRLHASPQGLVWQAPAAQPSWQDQSQEPDASRPLQWMLRLIGPWVPDHLL